MKPCHYCGTLQASGEPQQLKYYMWGYEAYPVYELQTNDTCSHGSIELTKEEYEDYLEVSKRYWDWQMRIDQASHEPYHRPAEPSKHQEDSPSRE